MKTKKLETLYNLRGIIWLLEGFFLALSMITLVALLFVSGSFLIVLISLTIALVLGAFNGIISSLVTKSQQKRKEDES
jgi:Flp pilus assembly protein TadB